MADFFKPEDFEKDSLVLDGGFYGGVYEPKLGTFKHDLLGNYNINVISTEKAAEIANLKIVSNFATNNYKPQENEIFLYAVVDNFGRIYYTGHNEALAKSYIEDNCLKDRYVVELKGVLNV